MEVLGHACNVQMVTLERATLCARRDSGSEVAMWVIVGCLLSSTRSDTWDFLLSSSDNEIMKSNFVPLQYSRLSYN